MVTNQARFRQLYRIVTPIIVLPIMITITTGFLYETADFSGKDDNFKWLLEIHRGDFGIINLGMIYPSLNVLGILTMVVTGITMWLRVHRRFTK